MSLVRHIARYHHHGFPAAAIFGRVPHRHSSNIRVEKEEGFAVMYMNRRPVNSYDREFLREMAAIVKRVEADDNMHGLIITSELKNIFSAGLELTELYRKSFETVHEFLACLLDSWHVYYGSRLATIAAINGHCLAGGVVTACLCDYRIMADGPYTIGFVEAQRDLVIPPWLAGVVQNTIGIREAERAIQLGLAYKPQDALRIGMVDELVGNQDKLLDRAREEMANWLKISSDTRATCKQLVRGPMLDQLRQGMDEYVMETTRSFTAEPVQRSIEEFMARKKKR